MPVSTGGSGAHPEKVRPFGISTAARTRISWWVISRLRDQEKR
jgi:hypothetical protein